MIDNKTKIISVAESTNNPKNASQTDGDEIVQHMAVEGQLRTHTSNLQGFVNRKLATGHEEEETTLNHDSDEQNQKKVFHFMRYVLYLLVIAAIVIGIIFAKKYINMNNTPQEHDVETVAEKYETFTVNGCSFNMVSVKGGTFLMGSNTHDGDEDQDELPNQLVTLSDFAIGETEVTQGLWKAVMGSLPIILEGDNHPMKNVSWDDCIQFINKLNKLTGRHFHLPSEAQWEYAAKGGNKSQNYKYAGSNNIDEVAWYGNGDPAVNYGGNANGKTHEVKKKSPNLLGLYDMSGNVWETCWDWWSDIISISTTPAGSAFQISTTYKACGGGSWNDGWYNNDLASTHHYAEISTHSSSTSAQYLNGGGAGNIQGANLGFRVVRSAQ